MMIHKESKQDHEADDYSREKSQDNKLTKEYSKDKDTKQKSKSQKKKKLEPSLKWRALGMEEYKEGLVLLFWVLRQFQHCFYAPLFF